MIKTQAVLITQKGSSNKAFKLSTIELDEPKANEVVIEVEAFGLNYADVMLRLGKHSDKPTIPFIPGYEVVGNIILVGSSVNTDLLGKRVVAITLLRGYAQHVVAPVETLAEIGEINANIALALALQGVTAYYMCCVISPVMSGENVLVHAAAGGVGNLLIQLAKNANAVVIAKVGSEEKRRKCLTLGADFSINYKTEDYVSEVEKLIGKNKLDVSFNPVAGQTFQRDRKLLGNASRLVLFGGLELVQGRLGVLSQLNFLNKMGIILPIFLSIHSRSIIGVNMLKIAETKPELIGHCLKQMLFIYRSGKIRPENGGDFSISELDKAHKLLESGKTMGKLTIQWEK